VPGTSSVSLDEALGLINTKGAVGDGPRPEEKGAGVTVDAHD